MAGETVWVLPRQDGPDDAHGNPSYTWPAHTDPAAAQVDGATVSPRTGSETDDPTRETVIIGLTVYLPAGVRMEPVDRMYARGETYEVVGEPGVWTNPWTQQERGVQVALKRTEG